MHTSYSALDTFKTCPQKYKFQEIEKRKSPKRMEQVFGTVVHSALKYMFERQLLYPTLDEVVNHYATTWNEAMTKLHSGTMSVEKRAEEEKLYYDEGIAILRNFYKKNKPWNFNTVELENKFITKLIDEKTGITHTLAGVIDRMDKDPQSGVYEIIDYKTGRKMPSQEMLEENMQLGLYSLAIHARWPDMVPENIKTSLYFLKHNEKISTKATLEKLEIAKKRILVLIAEIEKRLATDNFPPTPGPLCNYCGFRPICPMWSHEYKKEMPPTPSDEEAARAIKDYFAIKDTEDTNKKRMGELRAKILAYMGSQKITRVFGSDGYITKTTQERVSFDMEKVRAVLEKLGKWNEVLAPDPKKITSLLTSLSEEEQETLRIAEIKHSFITLKASKKQ